MLELMPLKRLRSVICAVVVLLCANSHVAAQEEGGGSVQAVDDSDGIPGQFLLNGLTLGRRSAVRHPGFREGFDGGFLPVRL